MFISRSTECQNQAFNPSEEPIKNIWLANERLLASVMCVGFVAHPVIGLVRYYIIDTHVCYSKKWYF